MKVKVFFLPREFEAEENEASTDHKQASLEILNQAYSQIQTVVEQASEYQQANNDTLVIVVGHEDFFCGGGYLESSMGCINRDTAIEFFKQKLTNLSNTYPEIVIAPGTVYLSTPADVNDRTKYAQEGGTITRAKHYVQNVAPVFHQGEWLRLVKKGVPLLAKFPGKKRTTTKLLTTEEDFLSIVEAHTANKIEVQHYHEDELIDEVPDIVFFGETPLPGETTCLTLNEVDTSKNFFSPYFQIGGYSFALEICADHGLSFRGEKPAIQNIDIHILSCNGQGYSYDATKRAGIFIRADANSSSIRVASSGNQLDRTFIDTEKYLFCAALSSPLLSLSFAHPVTEAQDVKYGDSHALNEKHTTNAFI